MKLKNLLLFFFFLSITNIIFAQTSTKTTIHDGETRVYDVYLPTNYVAGEALPLVINMHGLGSNIAEQTFYAGFNAVADANNFIVVHPQGLEVNFGGSLSTHWNANFGTGVDDVGFLNKIIDEVYTDYSINLAKVYATGMSNGGYMSYVLACELSDRIAAIASVTGAMTTVTVATCNPDRAIPIMQIHGTNDELVAYGGDGQFTLAAADGVGFWVEHNGCDVAERMTVPVADIDTTDNSTASLDLYPTCNEGTEVHFYTIQNGSHTWPGAISIPGFGVTNQDLEATQVIWEFFNKFTHPNPSEVIVSTKNLRADLPVAIAPNPFTTDVLVSNESSEMLTMQLVNILGQPIQDLPNLAPFNSENLVFPDLQNGIYFLILENEKGRMVKKLVKE